MPQEGLLHNGIPIPVPPVEVLKLGEWRETEEGEKLFLVLFFDTKRTWYDPGWQARLRGEYDGDPSCSLLKAVSCLSRQWLPRNKLLPLGMDDTVDKLRLMEGKKPSVRKSVHTAYDRAMVHLNHVRGNLNFAPSNFI